MKNTVYASVEYIWYQYKKDPLYVFVWWLPEPKHLSNDQKSFSKAVKYNEQQKQVKT